MSSRHAFSQPALSILMKHLVSLVSMEKTAVVWHEAISGTRDEDSGSAFHKYIDGLRDTKKITMWPDNCSGQNKNWTLYTMMLFIVNSPNYDVEEIHLKYF